MASLQVHSKRGPLRDSTVGGEMSVGAIIVIGVLVLFVVLIVGTYNALVGKRNRYKNAYAQIDVQLKRRYDLIPNLVETVKGYLKHESSTLEAVIKARNAAYGAAQTAAAHPGDANALRSLASAEGALAQGLSRIIALSESYPELKASSTMAQLTEELTSTENRVAFSRQAYNDAATEYNNTRERLPAVLFASSLGFEPAGLLESIETPEERRAPKVSFS